MKPTGFRALRVISADIVERARTYRRHEDKCRQCMKARLYMRVRNRRCPEGQKLWNEVGL